MFHVKHISNTDNGCADNLQAGIHIHSHVFHQPTCLYSNAKCLGPFIDLYLLYHSIKLCQLLQCEFLNINHELLYNSISRLYILIYMKLFL